MRWLEEEYLTTVSFIIRKVVCERGSWKINSSVRCWRVRIGVENKPGSRSWKRLWKISWRGDNASGG